MNLHAIYLLICAGHTNFRQNKVRKLLPAEPEQILRPSPLIVFVLASRIELLRNVRNSIIFHCCITLSLRATTDTKFGQSRGRHAASSKTGCKTFKNRQLVNKDGPDERISQEDLWFKTSELIQ